MAAPRRWRARWMAVATIVSAGAVVLSGCDTAPDAATSSDPASLATDQLFEAFNAQDAEGVADVFGDDVAFTLESGEVVVGADATTFWQGYFGVETAERKTEAFHASDGRTYFLVEFARVSGGVWSLVFDVEMDGERLVRMGARPQDVNEIIAAREIDDLYEALNDQDADRLAEEFEGMTYRSPSGAEFTGAEAAEHWGDAFGFTVTRATGVFEIGEGVYGFVTEHTERDSGRSTAYAVEVDMPGVQVTKMIERRPQA